MYLITLDCVWLFICAPQDTKTTCWRREERPKTATWVSCAPVASTCSAPAAASLMVLHLLLARVGRKDVEVRRRDAAGRSRADTERGRKEGKTERKKTRGQEECSLCCNSNHYAITFGPFNTTVFISCYNMIHLFLTVKYAFVDYIFSVLFLDKNACC